MADMAIDWREIVALLREGAEATAAAIEDGAEGSKFAQELRGDLTFLDQIEEWIEKLPAERIRTTIFSFISKLDTDILSAVRHKKIQPESYGANIEHPSAPFVEGIITKIGPRIAVSTDQMKVRITVEPEFAHSWNVEKIIEGLSRLGIQGEIQDRGIERALKHPGKSIKVVDGRVPVSGRDAVIEDCLGLDLDGIPSPVSRNRVDLKSLNWVHNIAQGQVLLKKTPATPGVPGMDVFGGPIPCRDGVDIPFPQIANTGYSDDGHSLLALVDGCAYKDRDSLVVVPTLEIKNNIDYSTGHVSAEVTVNVDGDVLSGFRVESNNDIHVKGTVEGSRLTAKGSIFLPGGVQGKSEAVIVSGKHVEVKFLNAVQVTAKGEIIVHGSIIQSHLRAWRVEAVDQEADIIGGIIEAEEDVCADTFGSAMGVKTVIRLGHDLPEIVQKIEKLQEQIKQLEEKKKQCNENLDKLERIKKQSGTLSSTQEKMRVKLLNNQEKIEEAIGTRIRQLELTEEALEKAKDMKRMVRARKGILPGVEVHIFEHSFIPVAPTGPVTIFATLEGIEEVPFETRTFAHEEEVDE